MPLQMFKTPSPADLSIEDQKAGKVAAYYCRQHPELKIKIDGKKVQFTGGCLCLDDKGMIDELDNLIRTKFNIRNMIVKVDIAAAEVIVKSHMEAKRPAASKSPVAFEAQKAIDPVTAEALAQMGMDAAVDLQKEKADEVDVPRPPEGGVDVTSGDIAQVLGGSVPEQKSSTSNQNEQVGSKIKISNK